MTQKLPVLTLNKAFGLLALLYATLEFYPAVVAANSWMYYLLMLSGVAYMLIFPRTPILDRDNYVPVLFISVWLAYAMFSYVWAVDTVWARQQIPIIARYLGIFLLFSVLFRNPEVRDKAYYFFLLMLLAWLATAVWEFTTLQHLWSSRLYQKLTWIPCGPFYGENTLAAMLLMLLPLLIFMPKLSRHWYLKLVAGLLILLVLTVILVQGARIALIAALGLLALTLIGFASWRTQLSLVLILLILISGIWLLAPEPLHTGWKMLSAELSSIREESSSARMSSVQIRKQLLHESLDIAAESHFLGVGSGNFERQMSGVRMTRTGGITNAHNFWMELLGNFGLGLMLGFMGIYLWWLYSLYCGYRFGPPEMKYRYLMYFFVLLMFIPASALPSSIRWDYLNWIIFAHMNSMARAAMKKEHESI